MDVVRTEVNLPQGQGRLAFILDNILTEAECRDLIRRTEDQGYEPALLNVGPGRQELVTDVRKSERCIIDSVETASWIWERIRENIPDVWKNYFKVVGLNERLRFLKYGPGEYFAPHFDGRYRRPDGSEESFITIQLYLNEGFEGGNTTFISSSSKADNVGVVPRIGRVLVFQHDILHEGSLLVQGTKYTMRTDVMYRKLETNQSAV